MADRTVPNSIADKLQGMLTERIAKMSMNTIEHERLLGGGRSHAMGRIVTVSAMRDETLGDYMDRLVEHVEELVAVADARAAKEDEDSKAESTD